MPRRRDDDTARAVVLVGHCRPDAWMLSSMVRRVAPAWRVEMVGSDDELAGVIAEADVLLVNRVLDGAFGDVMGVTLIERLAAGDGAPPMILISNHADAQENAARVGARDGFGKRDLNTPRAAELLLAALGES